MAEHAHAFFTLSLLTLAVVLLVFGMKYFSAARQAGGRAKLFALQDELIDVKTRLASIEKLLKDVG